MRGQIQIFRHALQSHFFACLSLALISCTQGTTLVCWDLATNLESISSLPDNKIPFSFFLDALKLRSTVYLFQFLITTTALFAVQFGLILLYANVPSIDRRLKYALFIWSLPGLLLIPTVIGTVIYFISPAFAISFLLNLIQNGLTKEDAAEGWIFPLAAIGWFNLFWLGTLIQCWLKQIAATEEESE